MKKNQSFIAIHEGLMEMEQSDEGLDMERVYMAENVQFDVLKGRTITSWKLKTTRHDGNIVEFLTSDGAKFRMCHEQECCEQVGLEDICGDMDDILGSPILLAEEVSNKGETEWGTETWTFYKLSTIRGSVTLRFYGSSNGYYSESVDFVQLL